MNGDVGKKIRHSTKGVVPTLGPIPPFGDLPSSLFFFPFLSSLRGCLYEEPGSGVHSVEGVDRRRDFLFLHSHTSPIIPLSQREKTKTDVVSRTGTQSGCPTVRLLIDGTTRLSYPGPFSVREGRWW